MKRSKLRIFAVWLMALAVVFSSIQIDARVFAQGGAGSSDTLGKDIGTIQDDAGQPVLKISNFSLWKDLKRDDRHLYYKDGQPVDGKTLELKTWNQFIIGYDWEITTFNKDSGDSSRIIRSGDYFDVALPASAVLNYHFDDKKPIDNDGTIIGEFYFLTDSDGVKTNVIRLVFNDEINSLEHLKNGRLDVKYQVNDKSGEIDFGDGQKITVTSTIAPKTGEKEIGPTKLRDYYKEGWSNTSNNTNSWFIYLNQADIPALFSSDPSEGVTPKNDVFVIDRISSSETVHEPGLTLGTAMYLPKKDDVHSVSDNHLPVVELRPTKLENHGYTEATDENIEAVKILLKAKFSEPGYNLRPIYTMIGNTLIFYFGDLGGGNALTYTDFLRQHYANRSGYQDITIGEFVDLIVTSYQSKADRFEISAEQKAAIEEYYGSTGKSEGKIVNWRIKIETKINDPLFSQTFTNSADILWDGHKGETNKQNANFVTGSASASASKTHTFDISKTWIGEGKDEVTIKMYKTVGSGGEQFVEDIVLKSADGFRLIRRLPVVEGAQQIRYRFEEVRMDGYEQKMEKNTVDATNTTIYTFTNTKKETPTPAPETVTLRVEKQWKNADGTAMDASAQAEIGFRIFANDVDTNKDITVGTDSGSGKVWTADSEALPKHDDARAEIVYTVKEATPDGFTSEIKQNAADPSEPNVISFTAINTKKAAEDTNTPQPNPPSGNTPSDSPSNTTPSDRYEEEPESEREEQSNPTVSTTSPATTAAVTQTTAETAEETSERRIHTPEGPEENPRDNQVANNIPPLFTPPAMETTATTSRTFEFVEIDEDIPLGMKTTAPIDLELFLIDEDIPLATAWYPFAQLPYTGFAANELFLGVGLFIITIGAVVIKRWL